MTLPTGPLGRRSEEMLLFAFVYAQQQGRAATLSDAARALSLPHRFNAMYYAEQLERAGLLERETRMLSLSFARPLRLTSAGEARALQMRGDASNPVIARVLMGLIDERERFYRFQRSKSARVVWYALRELQAEARFLLDAPRSHVLSDFRNEVTKGGDDDERTQAR